MHDVCVSLSLCFRVCVRLFMYVPLLLLLSAAIYIFSHCHSVCRWWIEWKHWSYDYTGGPSVITDIWHTWFDEQMHRIFCVFAPFFRIHFFQFRAIFIILSTHYTLIASISLHLILKNPFRWYGCRSISSNFTAVHMNVKWLMPVKFSLSQFIRIMEMETSSSTNTHHNLYFEMFEQTVWRLSLHMHENELYVLCFEFQFQFTTHYSRWHLKNLLLHSIWLLFVHCFRPIFFFIDSIAKNFVRAYLRSIETVLRWIMMLLIRYY